MIIKKFYLLLIFAYGLTGCQPNNGGNEKIISADSSRQVDCVQVALPEVDVKPEEDSIVNTNFDIIGSTGDYLITDYCSHYCLDNTSDECGHKNKKRIIINGVHRLDNINFNVEHYSSDNNHGTAFIDFYHENKGSWNNLVRFKFRTCLINKQQILLKNPEIDSFTFLRDEFYNRCNWTDWKNRKNSKIKNKRIYFKGKFFKNKEGTNFLEGDLFIEGKKYKVLFEEQYGC